MPCLFAVIALITPRFVIIILWLLSDWFTGVFDDLILPVVGFIFAPTTLLWYSAVQNWYGGEWGAMQIVVAVIALIIDLSPASSKRNKK
ncbi:MAG TPA: hypothetical protein VKP65_11145 [Rhodothermales bacterium]|nr:hypothetical protein [Rhodothermales bacterium]